MDKCEKHDETMDRVFTKINEAEKKLESIDTKMDGVIAFKDLIHSIIFGNGKEGIVSKINRITAQCYLQWGILVLLIVALIVEVAKK